jgi:hypothetical protein
MLLNSPLFFGLGAVEVAEPESVAPFVGVRDDDVADCALDGVMLTAEGVRARDAAADALVLEGAIELGAYEGVDGSEGWGEGPFWRGAAWRCEDWGDGVGRGMGMLSGPMDGCWGGGAAWCEGDGGPWWWWCTCAAATAAPATPAAAAAAGAEPACTNLLLLLRGGTTTAGGGPWPMNEPLGMAPLGTAAAAPIGRPLGIAEPFATGADLTGAVEATGAGAGAEWDGTGGGRACGGGACGAD